MRTANITALSVAIAAGILISSARFDAIAVVSAASAAETPSSQGLTLPKMDAVRGKELFADKGCVACHSINGVGGTNAAPLDAATMDPDKNPFEFFARMWLGTKPMIEMQESRMGQQTELTAQELGDIVAFIHDEQLQKSFSEKDIPDRIEDLMD